MSELAGRRAVVTGGGSGIGRAIASALGDAGATVLVADVDVATAPVVVCDVADGDAVAALSAEVAERLGGLDLLVNNVGVAGPTAPVADTDPGEFDETVRVNVGGTFRCTRLAVPRLRASGNPSIVNISSTAGWLGFPLRSAYTASKWAVVGLTKTWAMELGPAGIRVNAVCPGTVAGPRMDGVFQREADARGRTPDEIRALYADQTSMRAFVEGADIAAAVVWLASPAARYVSGQVLSVDGHTETLRTTWDDA